MTVDEGDGLHEHVPLLKRQQVRDSLDANHGYGFALVLILISFVVFPLLGDRPAGRLVVVLLATSIQLLVLRVSGARTRTRRFAAVFAVLAVVLTAGAFLTDRPEHAGAVALCFAILFTISPLAIAHNILRHRVITLNTVLGALCVYLIMGQTFAAIYAGVQGVFGEPFFVQGQGTAAVFQYFSYTTLTTVGYGDYTAATTLGRSLANLEAIIGQVLLVTAVARFVSMIGQERDPVELARLRERRRRPTLRRHREHEHGGEDGSEDDDEGGGSAP